MLVDTLYILYDRMMFVNKSVQTPGVLYYKLIPQTDSMLPGPPAPEKGTTKNAKDAKMEERTINQILSRASRIS